MSGLSGSKLKKKITVIQNEKGGGEKESELTSHCAACKNCFQLAQRLRELRRRGTNEGEKTNLGNSTLSLVLQHTSSVSIIASNLSFFDLKKLQQNLQKIKKNVMHVKTFYILKK